MSTSSLYPTELTDAQWHYLHPLLPVGKWRPGGPGRPPLQPTQRAQWHSLRDQDRVSMVYAAPDLRVLENGVWLL